MSNVGEERRGVHRQINVAVRIVTSLICRMQLFLCVEELDEFEQAEGAGSASIHLAAIQVKHALPNPRHRASPT